MTYVLRIHRPSHFQTNKPFSSCFRFFCESRKRFPARRSRLRNQPQNNTLINRPRWRFDRRLSLPEQWVRFWVTGGAAASLLLVSLRGNSLFAKSKLYARIRARNSFQRGTELEGRLTGWPTFSLLTWLQLLRKRTRHLFVVNSQESLIVLKLL